MFNKILAVLIFIFISLFGLFFFFTSESYKLSFKSGFYYSISNYQQSYDLALKAYKLDWKNKMASSLLVRSDIALNYEKYINQGEEYLSRIRGISAIGVDKTDKKRIELMCDIMIEQFKELHPKKIYTTDELFESAKNMQDNFKRLKSELFKN